MWENDIVSMLSASLCHAQGVFDVAERLGYTIIITPRRSQTRAVCVGKFIVVSECSGRELERRIAHELAESLLLSEWEPPYNYIPTHSAEYHRHRIATLLEARFSQECQ